MGFWMYFGVLGFGVLKEFEELIARFGRLGFRLFCVGFRAGFQCLRLRVEA